MNSLTELLKNEKNQEVIKKSYEFWKSEGKQHLFIDFSIAFSNTEALKIILVTEGPEIFMNAYSYGSKKSPLDIISMLCKSNRNIIPVHDFLHREIRVSYSWHRKKIVLWLLRLKKLNKKLPYSITRYLIQKFI
ncbi:hypothetical protein SteCoe_10748 [Stentor coeruleus]|uniref:Uncharacterized protein n=1 Tax=Stentor coeruleus TaxID=5963 RepID=A0A1R2CEX5_9CILI|nr:hypothetical protein SteCoe_10748 [Stentor coeruleus]